MWRKLKIMLGVLLAMAVLAVGGWGFVHSLHLDREPQARRDAVSADLAFVRNRVQEGRGRILAVLTNVPRIPATGKKAGFELTELARAYWVFVANGYDVDLASPQGGEPPMVLDDDLVDADYAFLNDADARRKLAATRRLAEIDPRDYQAVYFVGGKGAMFDFPGNADIARIVRDLASRGVVGAVCHGPAALIGIEGADGRPLLHGRRVTGFSNQEELFLIEDARAVFPFLLQDRLAVDAAPYVEGPMYLDNTVVDGRLVTGQNPWSTWSVAEAMVRLLGHEPVPREITSEEVSVRLLATYRRHGLDQALAEKAGAPRSSKHLLVMHALVAAMQWRLGEAWELQRLARN